MNYIIKKSKSNKYATELSTKEKIALGTKEQAIHFPLEEEAKEYMKQLDISYPHYDTKIYTDTILIDGTLYNTSYYSGYGPKDVWIIVSDEGIMYWLESKADVVWDCIYNEGGVDRISIQADLQHPYSSKEVGIVYKLSKPRKPR